MRHPYEKFIRIELLSIVFAILIGIFALVKGYLFLIFFCFYLLALSLTCESLVLFYTYRKTEAGKQILRATALVIFTTYILFKL